MSKVALARLLRTLAPQDRRRLVRVIALMVLLTCAELAGIGAVFGFVRLAAEPELIEKSELLFSIYELTGAGTLTGFLVPVGIAVIAVFLLKIALTYFARWYQLDFAYKCQYEISARLLQGYLAMPYDQVIRESGTRLGHRVLVEVDRAVNGAMIAALGVAAEVMIGFAIAALLFWYDPRLTFMIAVVLGVAYGIVYALINRVHQRLGVRLNEANVERYAASAQAFEGAKEIRACGAEGFFLDRFRSAARRVRHVVVRQQTLSELPRSAIEAVAIGGVLLIILVALGSGGELTAIVPTLALYAAGMYRLMPSLNRILNGVAQYRFNQIAAQNVVSDIERLPAAKLRSDVSGVELPFERAIFLKNVTYIYPGSDRPAVDGVSLTIRKGSTVALVGPTGSGKSTLASLVLGLLSPTYGTVVVDDAPLDDRRCAAWRTRVGYVPQSIFLFNDTVARNIAFGVSDDEIDMQRIRDAARQAHIDEFIAENLPNGYETMIGDRGVRLSGGEGQRIGIARALYRDPDVIVFDEATSALDGHTEALVHSAIRNLQRDRTVLLVAHRLATVETADTIYVMDNGRIVDSGSYAQVINSSAVFRAMANNGP